MCFLRKRKTCLCACSIGRLVCALTLLSICSFSLHGQVQRRLALVIGNDDYTGLARLNNGVSDATLITQTLVDVGVDSVIFKDDLDRVAMETAFSNFFRAMTNFDVGIIYYAGHGMQDEFGDGFLIPTDFPANQGQEALFNYAYPLDRILRRMRGVDSKSFVAFLDACRNNPYSNGSRSGGGGLGVPRLPAEGMIVGYSTMAGSIAGDYGTAANGLYATALSNALQEPNVPIETLLKNIGGETRKKSNGQQNPEWWGNISGDVFIHHDPHKYEVALMEVQDAIVERIQSIWSWPDGGDFWQQYSSMGVATPDWLLEDGAQLQFISLNHQAKGLTQLAEEAELFRLWLNFVDASVNKGGVAFVDSIMSNSYAFNFHDVPNFFEQRRFCDVFGLRTEAEYELFVNYLILTMDGYDETRLERMKRFRDLLLESVDPSIRVIGHYWLRVIAQKHAGYEAGVADNYSRPKEFPFVVGEDGVVSVLKESLAWSQGLREGCVFIEKLEEEAGVQKWLVEGGDKVRFEVEFESGSYFIQKNGEGMVMIGDAELIEEFELHAQELQDVELEELKWIIGVSDRCPDYMRVFPCQAMYVAAFNLSEGAASSASSVRVSTQSPDWDARLAVLNNSLGIARGMHELQLNGTGIARIFYRRLGYDVNSLFVWLSNISEDEKRVVNWRKVKKLMPEVISSYRNLLDDFNGYSGLLDAAFPQYSGYSVAGKLFDAVSSYYFLDDECSFGVEEKVFLEDALSRMDDEWYLAGGEVDLYYLNYAGSRCWSELDSDPDAAVEFATEALSIWTDSIYHPSTFEVNSIYESSPFVGFLAYSDLGAVDDALKMELIQGLAKMNANFSCGYVRPVYWGLRIASSIDVPSLDMIGRQRLERSLLLLIDSSFLCSSSLTDENRNLILEQLSEIRSGFDGDYWFSGMDALEDFFEYRLRR